MLDGVSQNAVGLFIRYISRWDVLVAATWGLFVLSCLVEKVAAGRGRRPMIWPVFGIIPSIPLSNDRLYDWGAETLLKAGCTFPYRGMWFGGSTGVMTSHAENIEYMLTTRFSNYPKGDYFRERFRDLMGDGIFNADGATWKEQRQLATSEMYTPRFAHHSYRTVQELVHRKLLPLLSKVSDSGEAVDLQDILHRFTFDNICTAAFGVDPGCLAVDLPVVPFVQAFEDSIKLTMFRFLVPPYVWKPMRYFQIGTEKRLSEAIKIVHEFPDKTVSDRRKEKVNVGNIADRSDLLSRLMEHPAHEFSNKYLRDICITFVLAGRDTSSVALCWFFWLLWTHPEVEAKILRQLNEILLRRRGGGEVDSVRPCDDVIFTPQELTKMAYLQAALSESLRLYPAVPMEMKQVQEDDVLPDGSALKKGARVFYSIYTMGRMESLWGKDCLEFRPERWMKGEEFVPERNQFKFPVFNGGPRLCIGMKFAYMQMKMVAASVLLRYAVEVVEGHRVVPKLSTTLYMKYGLQVTVRPRTR